MAYMAAKSEKRRTELYAMDLVWLLAKRYYDVKLQPSKLEIGKDPVDCRSSEQIKSDLLKKIKGD